jgi:60 kDa SS-A/Ro ribonucleoprotein
VDLSPKDRLDRAVAAIERQALGTDASLPFKDAINRKLEVDGFVLITDSETWAGDTHPAQQLRRYRRLFGRPAKAAILAMPANQYSIADPTDPGQLDVVGFDSTVPSVVGDFLRTAP